VTSPHPWEQHATRNKQQQRRWRAKRKDGLACASERDLLAGTCSPRSGQWLSEWEAADVVEKDDGVRGGEACDMRELAEMCRSRLEIFDPKTLPIFAKTTEDEGYCWWFLCGCTRKQTKSLQRGDKARENPSGIGASWEAVAEGKGGKREAKRKEKEKKRGGRGKGFCERGTGLSATHERFLNVRINASCRITTGTIMKSFLF
jgi:hypothetical protein